MQAGSSASHYDANGNLTAVTDATLGSNNRTYINDIAGRALYVSQAGISIGEVLQRRVRAMG